MLVTGKVVYQIRYPVNSRHSAALLAPGFLRDTGGIPAGGTARPSRRRRREAALPAWAHSRAAGRPRCTSSISPASLASSSRPAPLPAAAPRAFPPAPGWARQLRPPPQPARALRTGRAVSGLPPPGAAMVVLGTGRGRPVPGLPPPRAAMAALCGPGRGSRRPPSRGDGAGAPRARCSLSGQHGRLGFPSSCRGLPAEPGSSPGVWSVSVRLPCIPLRERAARSAGGARRPLRLEQPGSARRFCSCTLRSVIGVIWFDSNSIVDTVTYKRCPVTRSVSACYFPAFSMISCAVLGARRVSRLPGCPSLLRAMPHDVWGL